MIMNHQKKKKPSTLPQKKHRLEQCACVQKSATHRLLMHPTLSCT